MLSYGFPAKTTRLQNVHNRVARLILHLGRIDHITSVLRKSRQYLQLQGIYGYLKRCA